MRRVGPFTFNPATGTLVDDSGAAVTLKPRPLQLLQLFLAANEHRLPLAAIIPHLWPGDPPGAPLDKRYNDVNVAVATLRRAFGEHGDALLPRASKGEYRLLVDGEPHAPHAAAPPYGLDSRTLLDGQRLGAPAPFPFHSRTQVAVHGPHTAVLPRPKQIAANLLAGVTYHFFFGHERGQIAAAVRMASELYRETAAEPPEGLVGRWPALVRNLRLRFLARPQAPFDLTIVNAQDIDQMVVYLRQPGEALHERYGPGCASAYWSSLDAAPDLHRCQPIWAQPPLDLDEVLNAFQMCAGLDPDFPEEAWLLLIGNSRRRRPVGRERRAARGKRRAG